MPVIALQWMFLRSAFAPIISVLIGGTAVALWFLPFVQAIDGLSYVTNSIVSQYTNVQLNPVGGSTIPFFLGALFLIFLPFAPGMLGNYRTVFSRKNLATVFLVLLPIGWLVSVYSFIHFGDPGYILGMVPFIGYFIFEALREKKWRVIVTAIIGILAFELLLFGTNAFSYLVRLPRLQGVAHGAILLHDARLAQYEKVIRSADAATTSFFVVRGQYFTQDKTIDTYASPEIRMLTYYFPRIRFVDVLGVRDFYRVAYDYKTISHSDSVIPIPADTKRIVVFADYLHPDVYPVGIDTFTSRSTLESPLNWYEGDIDSIASFEFLGFTIRKQ